MDVDHNQATPMRYNIRGIPTLLLFKDGKLVEQMVGLRRKDEIVQALTRLL
jgi:thioredoxin 1